MALINLRYTLTPVYYDPGSVLQAELVLESETPVQASYISFECYNGTAAGPEGGQWSHYVPDSFRDLSVGADHAVKAQESKRGYLDITVTPVEGRTFSLPLHFTFAVRVDEGEKLPASLTMACTGYLTLMTAGGQKQQPQLVFAYQHVYRVAPPNVQVIKQAQSDQVREGNALWYQLSLQNASPIPIEHVRLIDRLDPTLTVEQVLVQNEGQPQREMDFFFDAGDGALYVPSLVSSDQLVVESGGKVTNVWIKVRIRQTR